MKIFKNKLIQRKMICMSLAILFGLLCVYLANKGSEQIVWGTPLMWAILYNRLLIGLFITVIGAFNWHGVLGFRYSPWLRGLMIGMVVSLDMAIGIFINPDIPVDQIKMIFWSTIIAGGIYGMIIDIVATRVTGEGKELLDGWVK